MKVEVEVISKEIIKPSSPTPDPLHHYKLSFLDQIAPAVYNPSVLFYELDGDNKFDVVEISNWLKTSLSELLTSFYPLAGRLKDNLFVDCNDEGIPFVETRVKCQLSDIIQNPVPDELREFVPFELDVLTDKVFGVQLNIFDCGGIAVGSCISHKIADGLSFFTLIGKWAAVSRGEEDIVPPQFAAATLFPPSSVVSGFIPRLGITKENITTKRFVFDATMIEELRAKFDDSISLENQKRPSRVEALSAFIWSRFVASTDVDQSQPDKLCSVQYAVNLRPRIDPPLSQSAFGNLFTVASTVPSLNTGEDLVLQVRDAISKINKDYVKKLQDSNVYLGLMKERVARHTTGQIVSFSFTSLCRFPVYEADFGWGKPTWFGSAALTFKNLVVFIDTKSGDGVEAYVSLKKEDMAKFEVDKELLEFVSPTSY